MFYQNIDEIPFFKFQLECISHTFHFQSALPGSRMSEAVYIVKNISLIQHCTTVTSAQWGMPDIHLGCERRFSSCRHTQVVIFYFSQSMWMPSLVPRRMKVVEVRLGARV